MRTAKSMGCVCYLALNNLCIKTYGNAHRALLIHGDNSNKGVGQEGGYGMVIIRICSI